MPRVRRDFEKEEAKLRKELDGKERWKAVSFLHSLEEDWARALVRAKPGGPLKTAMKAVAGPNSIRVWHSKPPNTWRTQKLGVD